MIDECLLLEDLEEFIEYDNFDIYQEEPKIYMTFQELEDVIANQPKVGEWIPCSERLPEEDGNLYWTTHEDGSIILHGYTNRNGFIYNWEVDDLEKRKRQGGVIAWMLIEEPEPYKEGKQ